MEEKLERIKRIANNVLYFNDSRDYEHALEWILEICTGDEVDEVGCIKDSEGV